jgi:hypothetical protein
MGDAGPLAVASERGPGVGGRVPSLGGGQIYFSVRYRHRKIDLSPLTAGAFGWRSRRPRVALRPEG